MKTSFFCRCNAVGRIFSPSKRAAGFSLIEVTLALMVVSMGLLTILGLFTAGLDQSARGRDASTASLFAEEVFSGLRAETDWSLIGASYNWPWITEPDGAPVWADMTPIEIDQNVHTNVYADSGNPLIVHHALRYRLQAPSYSEMTNYFDTNVVKCVVLETWPGRFGALGQKDVFYMEFFKFE